MSLPSCPQALKTLAAINQQDMPTLVCASCGIRGFRHAYVFFYMTLGKKFTAWPNTYFNADVSSFWVDVQSVWMGTIPNVVECNVNLVRANIFWAINVLIGTSPGPLLR